MQECGYTQYPLLAHRAKEDISLQEVFGGNAVSDEYHIGRHVANLFVTQTYGKLPVYALGLLVILLTFH